MVKINKKKKKRISDRYQTRHQKRIIITSEDLTQTEYHLNETKTQIKNHNKLMQYFTNENITHHIYHNSIYYQRTLERHNLIVFYYGLQGYVSKVSYLNNSIFFPIITIESFLTDEQKTFFVNYLQQHSNPLQLVLCGFTQKKLISAKPQIFNHVISKCKRDGNIAFISNRISKEESLLLCEPIVLKTIEIDCEFIILKIKNEVINNLKFSIQQRSFEIVSEKMKESGSIDEMSFQTLSSVDKEKTQNSLSLKAFEE